VVGFDAVESEIAESEIDHALARLGRVSATPAVEGDPVAELGAAVLSLDDEADCADERGGFLPDNSERRAAAVDPGRSVQADPFRCAAVGIGVGDVESGVRNLTPSGKPLDVEGIIGNERS